VRPQQIGEVVRRRLLVRDPILDELDGHPRFWVHEQELSAGRLRPPGERSTCQDSLAEAEEQSARFLVDVPDRPRGVDSVQDAEARVVVDHGRRVPVILLEPPADGGAIIVVAAVRATGDLLDHDLVGCVDEHGRGQLAVGEPQDAVEGVGL
jgi:hypothetical protein